MSSETKTPTKAVTNYAKTKKERKISTHPVQVSWNARAMTLYPCPLAQKTISEDKMNSNNDDF